MRKNFLFWERDFGWDVSRIRPKNSRQREFVVIDNPANPEKDLEDLNGLMDIYDSWEGVLLMKAIYLDALRS